MLIVICGNRAECEEYCRRCTLIQRPIITEITASALKNYPDAKIARWKTGTGFIGLISCGEKL